MVVKGVFFFLYQIPLLHLQLVPSSVFFGRGQGFEAQQQYSLLSVAAFCQAFSTVCMCVISWFVLMNASLACIAF